MSADNLLFGKRKSPDDVNINLHISKQQKRPQVRLFAPVIVWFRLDFVWVA